MTNNISERAREAREKIKALEFLDGFNPLENEFALALENHNSRVDAIIQQALKEQEYEALSECFCALERLKDYLARRHI
jgi:hypothetical protein